MNDTTGPSVFEEVLRERNQAERDLQGLRVQLATLVGAHTVAGSIPVDKIRALINLDDSTF